MKHIAWIGTGVMGHAMVSHLLDAAYPVTIYTRSKEKAMDLKNRASVVDSIEEAVKSADVIITIVGYPTDVNDVYQRIFKAAKKNALLIDMTTSSPSLAIDLYQQAKSYGLRMMDAPVSGGDIGAKNASLTIMVGGEETDYQEALEIFKFLGKTITYIGSAGFGQHCKMANQIAIAGAITGVSESIHYMVSIGLDPQKALSAIGGGSASSWQLLNNGPKMITGDFEPGFYIHHYVKDLLLAEEEAAGVGIDLPIVHRVLELYQSLVENGDRNLGTQAIIKAYLK